MDDKYELTYDCTLVLTKKNGKKVCLNRPRALRDIPRHKVKKGDLGGYIESEDNLSQYDECWVGKTGSVYGNANVMEDALVEGTVDRGAIISGDAFVGEGSLIEGEVIIGGSSRIGNALISS